MVAALSEIQGQIATANAAKRRELECGEALDIMRLTAQDHFNTFFDRIIELI